MAVVDLVGLVDQRMAQLVEEENIRAEETYLTGETGVWGLLSLYDDILDELLGYEFIETAESWRRPDAVLQYDQTAEAPLVLVIVPDESFVEMSEMLARAGDANIKVSDYSAMELVPQVLVG